MITAIFENNQLVSYSLKTWQYDYGQILRIEGLNLPTAIEIHFALTEKGGEAVTRIGMTKDGVTDVVIPDSFLENNDITQDYRIYAFIYLRDDTSGQTEYKIPISVTSRPKPEAFNRPEDGEIFKEAIQAVRQSADQAAESAKQAGLIKDSVQDMVDTIGSIDEQVQAVKEFAQKAETASSNAALSESRAKESKTAAETAKESAETAAESARQSATVVEAARQEVAKNKTAVEQAVSGFDGKVVEANIAIESAKTEAVKAVEDKGDEVLQSIPPDFETQMASKLDKQQGAENKGKALVVGEDGNVAVGEVTGGGGISIINTMSGASPLVILDSAERVNKGFGLVGNTEQASTTGTQLLDKDNFFVNPPTTFDELKYYPFSIGDKECTLSTTCPISSDVANLFLLPGNVDKGASSSVNGVGFGVSKTAKSQDGYVTIALRTNGDNHYNPLDYDIMLNYGSAATAYEPYTGGKPSPSPDYPQEIKNVGKWNEEKQKYEVDVKVTGKNLFDIEKLKGELPIVNYYYLPIYVKKGAKVSVSCKKLSTGLGFYALLSKEKGVVNNAYSWLYHESSAGLIIDKVTFMAESDVIYFNFNGNKQNLITELANFLQIEISDAPTEYQPYTEQTLTLTSDRPITKWDKLVERDGQIGWLYQNGNAKLTNIRAQYPDEDIKGKVFSRFETSMRPGFDGLKRAETLCTKLRNGNTDDDVFFNTLGGGYIVLYFNKNLAIDNTEKANAWILSNSDIDFLYYDSANTPIFIPLSQSEQSAIRALKTYYPTTVITVDGGEVDPNIEVTYTADTKNYIDQKIEAINKAIVTTQKALL